ncbi:hypothetical protein CAPTEDRAFT_226235 [Capitella teleta]|uniref:Uncharacterized protein n=1 Tax=Capitella teleta TaxID=283909 RepID=R7UPX5_CAPTE|nr:hypothetical protein CAPTEDRAFT_226235 [Capitella teleta]|eukprot:ELU05997.1 hypothetical protein CAPTEDRAFT_226235 [Capitella teleta]
MGVRRNLEVDTSFCTETEILEETAILPPQSGTGNHDNQDPASLTRAGFTLETPGAARLDVSSDDDEIIVGYQGSHGYVESTLFDDESSIDRQCSFYPPCLTSKEDNYDAVRHYELQYGRSHRSFSCLFDPDKPSRVIRRRRFKLHHVVHGLVWSIALFLSSLALLTFALRYKGCAVL